MTPHVLYAYIHMHLMATQGEIQLLRNTSSITTATTATAAATAASVGVGAAVAKEGGRKGGGLERFEMLYRKRWDARNQEGVTFPTPGFALQPDDAFLVIYLTICFLRSTSFFLPSSFSPFPSSLHTPSSLPPFLPSPYVLADPLPLRFQRQTNRDVLWAWHYR